MLFTALAGLATGLTLIVAIGGQNAFVLRQGLQRRHVLLVVAVCALSDLILIMLGVGGVGTLLDRAPGLITIIRWIGAAFLLGYGLLAARRAVRGQARVEGSAATTQTWTSALGTCLAFTWLNPHVYLDTVVLLGSVANSHGESERWWFAAGAGFGSLLWFSALGAGARLLAPLMRRPITWRVLDGLIAVTMLALGTGLLLS